jgi:hypothetical protein
MANRKQVSRWWLLFVSVAIAVALAVGLQVVVRRNVVRHTQTTAAQAIASLPQRAAAAKVRELLALDAEAINTIVPLLADKREPVADAAHDAIADLLTRWEPLAPRQSSPKIERLARELAAIAPHVPASRRQELHGLAARVLVWPVDADSASAPQVLADCEAVLRLPLLKEDDVRVATLPAAEPGFVPAMVTQEPAEAAVPVPAIVPQPAPSPTLVEAPLSPEPPPFYGRPTEPERLIDASRERAEEPRQIRPPKAIKIDG